MAYTLENGSNLLRAEVVDKTIKGFAEASYKFKQAVSIVSTNAWKNTYYRENSTALTNPQAQATINDISRGANFPQASVQWEKVEGFVSKFGLEDNIFWEDTLTDELSVISRTLFRIAEGVTKKVDDTIWDALTESRTPVNIQSIQIADTNDWARASAAIIDDLMQAKQKIAEYNYPVDNLICFISPKDHRSMVTYLAGKGAQFPSIGADMATNGRVGKIAGVDLVISNSVTASYALVVVPKICATWKEAVALSTQTIVDPYKSTLIRAVELGTTQLTDPKAVVLLMGTQD